VEKQNKTCFNFEFPERSLSSIVIKDASEWKNKIKLVLILNFPSAAHLQLLLKMQVSGKTK
jgi:hypothetical protein